MKAWFEKYCGGFWRAPFWRGLLIGGITVALLFLSWRFVLLALGVLAIWCLLCKRD